MNYNKVFVGILAGLAAGAILGILVAPEKGSTTRKKIAKKRDKYSNEISAGFNELVEDVSTKYEAMKKAAIRMTENGKSKINDADKEALALSNK